MSLVRVVQLLGLMAVLVFAAMPSPADAACACSRVGQSNGYYATPSAYGSYGYGYGATLRPLKPAPSSTRATQGEEVQEEGFQEQTCRSIGA